MARTLASLTCLLATAGDLDLTPLGVWPEAQLRGTIYGVPDGALANGRFFQPGAYRGASALLALEPQGAKPFQRVGALPLPSIRRLAIAGHRAIVVGSGRLFVVDISDPSNLQLEGMVWIGSVEYEPGVPLALSGTQAYLIRRTPSSDLPGASPAQITVVDFSDATHPRIVGEQLFPPKAAKGFWLSEAAAADGVVCVASSSTDYESPIQVVLDVFDLRDPTQPRWVGKHEAAKMENIHALTLAGRRAYWAPFALSGVTRLTKLEVVDLTDPSAPKLLGTYSTTGEVMNLAANERHVYAAKQTTTDAGTGSAVEIVDFGSPAAPKRMGGLTIRTFDTEPTLYIDGGLMVVRSSYGGTTTYDISDPAAIQRVGGQSDWTLLDVTVSGNRGFAVGIGQMKIVDLSQPEVPRLLGAYPLPYDLAFLGKVVVAGNHAYLPTSAGLHTIDVTDPTAPRRTSLFRSGSYFTGAAVEGSLLVAASSYDGVFFLDLADPAKPVSRGKADLRHNNITAKSVAISGHHVFVTSSDGPEAPNPKSGVLEVFDASQPALPQFIGAYEVPAVAREVAASGNLAVLTSYSSIPGSPAGMAEILDVSDPANPVLLSSSVAYDYGARVSLAENRAVLSGPTVLDLSDPKKPRQLVGLDQWVGSATISGDLLFAGLNVYRMSPASLVRSRTINLAGETLGVALQGKLAWLASGQSGLQVVDLSLPDPTALVASLPLDGKVWDVAIAGNHALVAAGEAGWVAIDITDPRSPQALRTLPGPGDARAIALSGNTACVAASSGGVAVVDLTNPAVPRELARLATAGSATGVAWHGTHVLAACGEAGLQVLDLADPAQPKLVGSHLVQGVVEAVTVVGNHAFIADGVQGLLVLDVTDPRQPKRLGLASSNTHARSFAVTGRFAYVADLSGRIRVFDIGDPTHPREVGGTSALTASRLVLAGDRLLAAAGVQGLAEFDLFAAPLGLQAQAGEAPGTLTLRLSGPTGVSVMVQRSPDLVTWGGGPTVTLGPTPVALTIPAAEVGGFFRLKRL